jgi:hypothetical protein
MYGHCPLINLSQRGAESNSHLRSPNQSQSLLLSPPFVGLAVGFGLIGGGKYLLFAHFPSLASSAAWLTLPINVMRHEKQMVDASWNYQR